MTTKLISRKIAALAVGGAVALLTFGFLGISRTFATTAPVATNGSITTIENTAVSGTMMASDTNMLALPLAYSVVSSTSNGTLFGINTSTGAFTYTPNAGFTGSDSFMFMANNGVLHSNEAIESITVNHATTTAPVAMNGSVTTGENTAVSGTLSAQDTNTSTLPLAYSVVSGPSSGVLSNLGTSTSAFTYTPNMNFIGSDLFTFMVNNGVLSSATATESVTVNAATSTKPVIFGITATSTDTTATITWNTDQPTNSQVAYGTTTNYTASTMLNTNLMASHSVALSGLSQDATYHFSVMSVNASGTKATSSDQTFTTAPTNSSSSFNQIIENAIRRIEQELATLKQQVQSLLANQGGGNGNTSSTGPWAPNGPPSLDSIGPVRARTTVDFGGRNFGANEPVLVTSNGATVTTAHADDGGNFTTGSLPAPATPGIQTYTFTGEHSGITLSETLTVIP
ncbi:MAG TPA: Ig-like domain-containing protein [Candidatus Paceibacterota bacterium]|nr:Ig-like domain-containing protein [Candidatus Paceibacterota bacterium]